MNLVESSVEMQVMAGRKPQHNSLPRCPGSPSHISPGASGLWAPAV